MPRLRVVTVAARLPAWAEQACAEYAKRMPRGYEVERMSVKKEPHLPGCIALDERGKSRSSVELARWLGERMQAGQDLALLIGGADGYAPEVLARANERWSLSALTLPHALVRVVLAEQLYRAMTLLDGHPYHRE